MDFVFQAHSTLKKQNKTGYQQQYSLSPLEVWLGSTGLLHRGCTCAPRKLQGLNGLGRWGPWGGMVLSSAQPLGHNLRVCGCVIHPQSKLPTAGRHPLCSRIWYRKAHTDYGKLDNYRLQRVGPGLPALLFMQACWTKKSWRGVLFTPA